MRAAIALLALAAAVSGCGYKGPLYMPKPKPEAAKPAAGAPQGEEKKPADPAGARE